MDSSAADSGDATENGHSGPSPSKRARRKITMAEVLAEFSHHDLSFARINNGSFGSCPSSVLSAQLNWQRRFLAQPDLFYFDSLQPAISRSRSAIAAIVGASDPSEISLVDNATTAAAIVLQQIAWSFAEGQFARGDSVVLLHYAYGAVKKSIHAYVARAGATVFEVPLPFPVSSPDSIISEFRKTISLAKSSGSRIRLAVIDHITSMPCVVIPIKHLVRICREEGVDQVFVDAAHAIGNVPIDVNDIGADFYTSNLHKWFFCPPAVAFLHMRRNSPASSNLHHPVVSHEYGNGLPMESGWIGTRDYSPQLVIPDAIDFVNQFDGGIEGIQKRNHDKVIEMGEMLARVWGTELGSPPEMCGSMAMVGLPPCLAVSSDKEALGLRKKLREEFKVEVPIYYNSWKEKKTEKDASINGHGKEGVTAYVRISHQIYNVEDDYYRLRDAIIKLVEDKFTCSMLHST